jgi:acyl-CoA synthetase (AMP-forming)/AMP-acid ligase II
VHIVLRLDSGVERPITYGELAAAANAVATALRERGVHAGDCIAIMLRTEPAFFPVFFGVLLAGAIPVLIYPPFRPEHLEEYARRQIGILRNAEARLLVTFAAARGIGRLVRHRVLSLDGIVTADELSGAPTHESPPAHDAEVVALTQYTSESTGDPKGVVLTHGNLLANIRALGGALAVRPDDVCVSWLPLYHDMGSPGSVPCITTSSSTARWRR